MTKVKLFGILSKLSVAARAAAVSTKKEFEKFKKVLDSLVEMCYLNQVAANDRRIASQKHFEKLRKKYLTNEMKFGILVKLRR